MIMDTVYFESLDGSKFKCYTQEEMKEFGGDAKGGVRRIYSFLIIQFMEKFPRSAGSVIRYLVSPPMNGRLDGLTNL